MKCRLCGLDNCGNQSPLCQSVTYSKIPNDSAKAARREWFFYESCSLWQPRGQTSRFRDTLVCVLRTSRSSQRRLWLQKRWCARNFQSVSRISSKVCFFRGSVTSSHSRSYRSSRRRSSFYECRGSAGTLWVSQSVVRFWIPYFWITSTPTSLLTIYSALWIGRRKKYMAWQKNRIIGVGTDLMWEKLQLRLSFENLRRDSPVFKFKFTLVCL